MLRMGINLNPVREDLLDLIQSTGMSPPGVGASHLESLGLGLNQSPSRYPRHSNVRSGALYFDILPQSPWA